MQKYQQAVVAEAADYLDPILVIEADQVVRVLFLFVQEKRQPQTQYSNSLIHHNGLFLMA